MRGEVTGYAHSTDISEAALRDAADTAFLTNTLADVDLIELRVGAEAPELEPDDPNELVELS